MIRRIVSGFDFTDQGDQKKQAAQKKREAKKAQTLRKVHERIRDIDYSPCRLPQLNEVDLTDPNKGLWEFWETDNADLRDINKKLFDLLAQNKVDLTEIKVRPRNPALDVRKEWVAIDFGTSSTVVAVATRSGGKTLLRVGVQDFGTPIAAKHYENPTILEFLDLRSSLPVWNKSVYRPPLNWNCIRASHEALSDFRGSSSMSRMVNSVLLHLKRWAMESDRASACLIDQKGYEYALSPLVEEHPVRGQPLQPREDASLDPVELYAWYLGMTINWRQRGLYLKYALTFPVKYPQKLRDTILASFKRGLQRSLPASLVAQSEYLTRFDVREVATEPMAYAAAMLPELEIEPTLEGVAYAVFDFGGGTTDFDFGLWRQPTSREKEEDGVEMVLERLGSGGDSYLGGENLLAFLAYQVIQDNKPDLYKHNLVFMRPLSETPFPGGESVLDNSSLAQANTAILVQTLRPLLQEPEEFSEESNLKVELVNRSGETVPVTFEIDVDALQDLLKTRIQLGVDNFLSDLRAAFTEEPRSQVHILLGGNASRGRWVKEAFDLQSEAWSERVNRYFSNRAPEFIVHAAEGADDAHPDQPNCKTGVALGALDLVPGSAVLKIDREQARSGGDAPFGCFVGPLEGGKLCSVFTPGFDYGVWQDLGPVREGIYSLAWSTSSRARDGLRRGDPDLNIHSVDFPGADKGWRCWGRVIGTNKIELAVTASREDFDPNTLEQLQEFLLVHTE